MNPSTIQRLTAGSDDPPMPPNRPPAGVESCRTVRVRRGTQGVLETVVVPPSASALHTGLQQLRIEETPECVDDWYVIEV